MREDGRDKTQALSDETKMLGVDGFETGRRMDGTGPKDKLCGSRIEKP